MVDNAYYNLILSQIRICSEHCNGYLKGRFQSLKELRIYITDAKSMKYATSWIRACIILHNFALVHEESLGLDKENFLMAWKAQQDKDHEEPEQEVRDEDVGIANRQERATELEEGKAKQSDRVSRLPSYMRTKYVFKLHNVIIK
ncbi:hypothetical protein LIPSTDRAFT_290286 [Lipomyces starkeyi NRRL Y-11557]|uniref:DDE Tnp4 domain-containing protein n=1 Tax=Lipomyces starkeyi NRRL Y-11557 TaxID=675824 RepID=A0A1E3Q8J0_LIPST|nr:hypothetical protein LIPSTDRAFT_290286 [Lipomyces starkeyi NRRL Y-11557]